MSEHLLLAIISGIVSGVMVVTTIKVEMHFIKLALSRLEARVDLLEGRDPLPSTIGD